MNPKEERWKEILRGQARVQEEWEEELKKYPLAAYSTRALKDELKRRKGKKA